MLIAAVYTTDVISCQCCVCVFAVLIVCCGVHPTMQNFAGSGSAQFSHTVLYFEFIQGHGFANCKLIENQDVHLVQSYGLSYTILLKTKFYILLE